MSAPAPGDYYIVNRVLSPNDQVLAITSNGQGQYATVTSFDSSAKQRWTIASNGAISPSGSSGLQVGWGTNGAIVLPSGGYVWNVRTNSDGTSIQDGGNTAYWGLSTATLNEIVGISSGVNPSFGQRWILIHV